MEAENSLPPLQMMETYVTLILNKFIMKER